MLYANCIECEHSNCAKCAWTHSQIDGMLFVEVYTMTVKEGKLATNAAHQAKLERIVLQPYREEGQSIKEAAKSAGKSTQSYCLQAIRQKMRADAAGEYLIRISKAGAAANAERKGQSLEDWLQEHQ